MTELEKLRKADTLIRDMTEGRLQIELSSGNILYVRPKDDAYIGLNMMVQGNLRQNCYEITFDANVRRMGVPMTTADLGKLAQEVQQAYALLTALEMYRFCPTPSDMSIFRIELLVQLHAPPGLEEEQTLSEIGLESVLEAINGEVNE